MKRKLVCILEPLVDGTRGGDSTRVFSSSGDESGVAIPKKFPKGTEGVYPEHSTAKTKL